MLLENDEQQGTDQTGVGTSEPLYDCVLCGAAEARDFVVTEGKRYWQCRDCDVTFLEPRDRLSRAEELAHYRLHQNDRWDPRYRDFLARLAEPLLQRLGDAREGLDFGCGPGPGLAEMLREAGHAVALYDPFFFPDRGPLQNRYDFITCTEAVEHFHRPAREFALFDRLIRPGGWIAVMTTFRVGAAEFPQWRYRRDPTHVAFFTEETFRHVARRFGWTCEAPARNVVLMQKRRADRSDHPPAD